MKFVFPVAACSLALAAVLFPTAARAHYIWLETHKGAPVLYFGEYDEKLHERSPGRLDDIRSPQAWTLDRGARRALPLERESDRFVGRSAKSRSVIAEETGHAVRDWTEFGVGIVRPLFYARYAASALERVEPALTLDVLPAGGQPGSFVVYFRGQPLPKAKLEIYAPNGWKQEHRAGESGQASFKLPWPGQYVVEVTHLEKSPGEFEGARYESLRHRATLTFRK